MVSEDDLVKKEEMKKSIFIKRKSNESSISPRANPPRPPPPPPVTEAHKVTAIITPTNTTLNSIGAQKPAANNNTFTFTSAKKATNDIIQNEILQKEILKRKSEEMKLKSTTELVSFY